MSRSDRRVEVVASVLVVLVVAATAGVAAGADRSTASAARGAEVGVAEPGEDWWTPWSDEKSDRAPVRADLAYSLTPADPGSIRVEVTLRVREPDAPDVATRVDRRDDMTVLSSRGFVEDRSGYAWDGETARPSLTARIDLAGPDTVIAREVDAGSWAFLQPGLVYGGDLVERHVDADVPVETGGGTFLLLGEHRTLTAERDGERVRLVVPAAADPASPPREILDSLAAGAAATNVSTARRRTVTAFVAPDPIRSGGLTDPSSNDLWVDAGAAVDEEPWLHEFTHSYQSHLLTPETKWTTEGFASFYGPALLFRQERATFGEFRRSFVYDERADAVLTSAGDGTDAYTKGAAVAAALDRRIRARTDGERSLQNVFRGMNAAPVGSPDDDKRIDLSDLQWYAELTGTDDLDRFFERYVRGEAFPRPPNDPSVYPFADTGTVEVDLHGPAAVGGGTSGAVDGERTGETATASAVSTGRVVVFDGPATVDDDLAGQAGSFRPRHEGEVDLQTRLWASTYRTAGVAATTGPFADADATSEFAVETGASYRGAYLQAGDDGSAPADGVPDLHPLGEFRAGDEGERTLPAARSVSVRVLGDAEGVRAAVGSRVDDRRAVVGDVPVREGLARPLGSDASVELAGTPVVGLGRSDTLYALPVDGPVAAVLRAEPAGEELAGAAYPDRPVAAGETVRVAALGGGESPAAVRVDGELVDRVHPQSSDRAGATAVTTLQFDEPGRHTVRVGDLPARTVRVRESPDAGTEPVAEGRLRGEGDRAVHRLPADAVEDDRLRVRLDGPASADFDLYAVGDDRRPTRSRYDASATGPGSEASLSVAPSGETVRVAVVSAAGAGEYELRAVESAGERDRSTPEVSNHEKDGCAFRYSSVGDCEAPGE